MFFVNSYLGPKVIMIKQMGCDMMKFLYIFLVVMIAYSISVEVLLHRDGRTFYWNVFWDLFQRGIWEIFGQHDDETMKGKYLRPKYTPV
uniref:Uncharacterized protein n=1 Tax=Plectus sambesii TaxID=2011161 RepID=A0A914VVB6_9BILA